jgi:hypothetical protein
MLWTLLSLCFLAFAAVPQGIALPAAYESGKVVDIAPILEARSNPHLFARNLKTPIYQVINEEEECHDNDYYYDCGEQTSQNSTMANLNASSDSSMSQTTLIIIIVSSALGFFILAGLIYYAMKQRKQRAKLNVVNDQLKHEFKQPI